MKLELIIPDIHIHIHIENENPVIVKEINDLATKIDNVKTQMDETIKETKGV